MVSFGLGRLDPRFHSPTRAIVTATAIAIVMIIANAAVLSADSPRGEAPASPESAPGASASALQLYDVMIGLVMFGTILGHIVAVSSIFALRIRHPDLARPFRTWGYPWTPAVYVLCALGLLVNILITQQLQVAIGSAIIVIGAIFYSVTSNETTRTRQV